VSGKYKVRDCFISHRFVYDSVLQLRVTHTDCLICFSSQSVPASSRIGGGNARVGRGHVDGDTWTGTRGRGHARWSSLSLQQQGYTGYDSSRAILGTTAAGLYWVRQQQGYTGYDSSRAILGTTAAALYP
jgi:hypothetical protein